MFTKCFINIIIMDLTIVLWGMQEEHSPQITDQNETGRLIGPKSLGWAMGAAPVNPPF